MHEPSALAPRVTMILVQASLRKKVQQRRQINIKAYFFIFLAKKCKFVDCIANV